MKGKSFKVPVSWQMYGYVTVEADTLQHAAEIAESDMGIGLPDNGEYVEGSWEVDWAIVEDGGLLEGCTPMTADEIKNVGGENGIH
jgi:hypothetical protein